MIELTLTDKNADTAGGCACGGGACGCGGHGGAHGHHSHEQGGAHAAPAAAASAVVTRIDVDGMTCQHCVSSVTEELTALAGVADVRVELVAGGTSTVTVHSDLPLPREVVHSAIAEAGYTVA